MRGIPGSGKSHVAKLIKNKETEIGGSGKVRILSIDDYFTTDSDVSISIKYEYEHTQTDTNIFVSKLKFYYLFCLKCF